MSGATKATTWSEWSVTEIGDVSDTARWAECNPSFGYRMLESTVRGEMEQMAPDKFARERLGWWSQKRADAALDIDRWNALHTEEPPDGGFPVFAVKFSVDGSLGVLSVCNHVADCPDHVEVVEVRGMGGGLQWFVDALVKVAPKSAQIIIDGASNAQTLIDKLHDRGIGTRVIIHPKTADVITACSLLMDSINDGSITHYGQEELDEAVKNSKKRNIGTNGGYGYGGDGAEILESIALALWGARTTKRNPSRKQRCG